MFTRIILILTLILPVCSAAPPSNPAPVDPARLYGSLEMAPSHFAIGREAGLRVAVVAVIWARFEPKPRVYDEKYIKTLADQKEQLRKLGYQVQVDLGVQYPPAWVYEIPQGRYTDQFGDVFVSTQPGADLPNVVFNAEIRKQLSDYFGQVFARLGNDWDFVRLGCARYGELNYPQNKYNGHDNCYWAFDDVAQGKAPGLPAGVVPCPVPGWKPGGSSEQHAAAKTALRTLLQTRAGFAGVAACSREA